MVSLDTSFKKIGYIIGHSHQTITERYLHLGDKDMDLIGEIVLTAKKLAFERGIQDSGYRLIWNTNGHGQQTVYHIHLHLIGGKQLSWNF